MSAPEYEAPELIDKAFEWLDRLRTEDASEGFFDWITQSPRHVEVFLQALTLEQRIAAISPEQRAAVDSVAAPIDSPSNIIPFSGDGAQNTQPTSRATKTWRRIALAAAAALIGITIWRVPHMLWGWQEYTTSFGEQRTIPLPDGSIVELNTASRLEVRFNTQRRDLKLLSGEALFKVQHDPTRPFRVLSADTTIQAVGTQFDVYRRRDETTVAVLEGKVNIQTASETKAVSALSAGETAKIHADRHIEHPPSLSVARATAWQQRRLIFDDETLTNIAYEFNRYNRRQFQIEGDAVKSLRFSGVFDIDDSQSFRDLLSHDTRLAVDEIAGTIRIRPRPHDT